MDVRTDINGLPVNGRSEKPFCGSQKSHEKS